MKRKNGYQILSLFLLICFSLIGCAELDVINYGLAGDGYNQLQQSWEKKSTPYLIKHLKIRRNYLDDYGNFKRSTEYQVILDILKKRVHEQDVCGCFQEIRETTKYDTIKKDMEKALLLCDACVQKKDSINERI